ncbi:MAG: hypothetical protein HW416_3258, partial [Chloroflexi bacterium]|nr:hypothetical protein [Chloroflexota bacterium]
QKDGDRFQGSNCGPAALAMILDGFGMSRTNGDLRFLMHTYQGTVGMRTGTALQHVAHVGQDLGLQPIGLYNGTDFTRWTVDDVRRELMAGRPVIPLVKYRLLPGHEESTVRFDHYVVIHGVDGDRFLYHDPSYGNELEGSSLWITADQLDAAMRIASVPRQAVAFAPGAHAALSALPV